MAGTARLTPGNAPTLPPPPSSSNAAAREGFAYPNLAAISNFPMGASLDQQRRAVDHHHHNQHHHHQQQQQQQQRQRELAMKRRIGEEIERERERERERVLLFERVRADRMVMERAARIAAPAGGGGRIFERDRVLAAAAERPIFADKRMDGPGILGNNASFPVPGRIAEMHVGSSMHRENALDRGLENLELPKGLENPRGIELSRVSENPRGFDIPRALENPGVLDIPRSMENPRMSEIPRGLDIPRSMENPRMLENARGMENPKGSDNLRGLNPRALEMVSQNPRSLEMSRDHPRSWGNPELSREKPRSLESSRVLDKSRGLENTRSLDNPMASDRRLESGNATGLDRRLDSIAAVERGLDATPDEGDSDRNGFKPSLRQASFERNRPTDWEREEDNSRDNDEKQKERPMDEAAIHELVAQYKTALAELTFNSKPIITNLTIIAGENLHASKAIASTVCNHILEVPVEQKLPSLYLLDSIVKNISSSYVKHFAARLPEVFIRSYRQVDPSLYPAMQHLFKTWRGVFTSEPLREIEAELQLNILGNGTSSYTAPASNPTRLNDSPSPQQRSGHGIHVNPKYLEAQRQKLQQSSQLNDGPSQIERGDAVPAEVISGRKLASSLPEFDYGSLDRNEKGGTSVERKNAWDRVLPSREEDLVRGPESSSFRYGMRNGYELQQHSPRALIDAYGNIRGIRAPRLPPVLIQPAQELDNRNRGQARDWQNSEEEEYSWADVSPRLLDVGESLRKEKDDWLHGGADKNLIPGSLTARKSFGLDQPLSGHSGWVRHGSWSGTDHPASAEDKSLRDIEERASLQDIGSRLDLDPLVDPPVMGPIGRPMVGRRPFAGRLPRPLTQQLSPSSQSRLRPLQVNRNTPPSVLGSTIASEATNPGPNSSSGLAVTDPSLASRSSVLPNLGSSFGGVNLNIESLSPVTPSGLNFQQRQHLKRPLSPPSLATSSEVHLPLPPLNPPLPNKHNVSSLQQHGFPLKSVQHQGQALDIHSHSSQQSVSLHPQQRPPLIHQPPLKPSGVPQPPLPTAQLQQTAIEQIPDQPLPQIVPVQPQIPTHLLESLKQLQRHLPPLSEAAPQPSHPLQPPVLQNSSQPSKLTQSPQRSLGKVPILQGQQLPQAPALVGSVLNDNASALLSGPQSHVSTNHLLAAFLQIGLIPPQASQMLSEPGVSSLVPPSEPTISQLTQAHPPLPSGPPPPSAGQSTLYAPAASTLTSSLLTLAPLPLPPAVTSTRLVQPPLPPGPPPPSSQVASSVSHPVSSAGSNLTSLLSSLMAQGMISAPSASIPPQSTGVAPNVSMGLSFPNPSSNTLLSGVEPSSRLAAPSATVVSTTLVTALRNQEPTPKATSALTDEGLPSGLNVNEFKQELLRDRQESVIKALYSDFPRQCTTCGLRFKYQEEHSKHMDWHVSRNRRQKSSKKVSRKWFVSVKEWLDGTGAASSEVSPAFFADEVAEKPEEEEVLVAVPADENQIACALCGEPFEDFYSDDTEEWMYRGAVYMNAPGGSVEGLDSSVLGPIVHAKCRSESAASTLADSTTEDADLENEDDLGHSQKRTRF